MVANKKIKTFSNLDNYPDLKEAVSPSIKKLPSGAVNTKVIICNGEVIERVYKTPRGEIISIFKNEISKDAA